MDKATPVAPVDAVVSTDIEQPLVVDAIRCRLRQDVGRGVVHSIPTNELRLLLNIVDCARHCVREWSPTSDEKARGAGTGVGMRAAEDQLIRAIKSEC